MDNLIYIVKARYFAAIYCFMLELFCEWYSHGYSAIQIHINIGRGARMCWPETHFEPTRAALMDGQ